MTRLVLTGLVEIAPDALQATFTDEDSAMTAVTQFDLRRNDPGSGRLARIVDPISGDCRPALKAHSAGDVLACIEEDAVDATAFEFARAVLGGAIPPTTSDALLASREATARERLRHAVRAVTGGAA